MNGAGSRPREWLPGSAAPGDATPGDALPGSAAPRSGAGQLTAAPLLPASFVPVLLPVLAAVALYAWPAAGAALEYHRERIATGELWRLLTCQLTHWSPDHLLLDAVVFAVLGSLVTGRRLAACLAVSALVIPAGLWLLAPELARYRGLSGIDAALFALVAVTLRSRPRADEEDQTAGRPGPARPPTPGSPLRWSLRPLLLPALALAALAGKIAYELATGQALFLDSVSTGFVPVPLAHALGALVGVGVGLWPDPPTRPGSGPGAVATREPGSGAAGPG